jgi:hypothetical protein
MLMVGLDFQDSPRYVRLKKLSGNVFSVDDFKIVENLRELAPSSFVTNIAIPEDDIKKLDKILLYFQEQNIPLHAVSIETDTIARALRLLCEITEKCFAILYITQHKVSFSIFENFQKIFFYGECIYNNNIKEIIHRAFKISEVQYQNCYVIGEHVDALEWGSVPDISKNLRFNSIAEEQQFKKENTKWLLACGLSLWNKKTSNNLIVDQQHKAHHKTKLIKIIILFLCFTSLIFVVLLAMPHKQKQPIILIPQKPKQKIQISQIQYPLSELVMSGTLSQEGKLWGVIYAPDHHIYFIKTGDYIGSEEGKILEVNSREIKIQISENKDIFYLKLQ